jgi:hypothetical protein
MLTVVDVLKGGDCSVCTGGVDEVKAELGD